MDVNERLAIEAECQRLSIRFSHLVDARRYDEIAGLFAEDGSFERFGKIHVGREAIAQELNTRATDMVTRHLCASIMIDVADADHARGTTYFIVARHDGIEGAKMPYPLDGLDAIGEFHDGFVRTALGWRIASRKVVAVFRRRPRDAAQKPAGGHPG